METGSLREYGLKNTPSRQAVLAILAHTEEPVTAEEVYRRILSAGEGKPGALRRVSLSTVYRTLATLAEKGLLLKSTGPDGALSYQLRDSRHRHYLICTRCGSAVPISGCPLEALEQSLGKETGFSITGHNLELYGLCPRCAHPNDVSKEKWPWTGRASWISWPRPKS